MKRTRGWIGLVGFGLAGVLSLRCESIIGIEDHVYDADAGAAAVSTQCSDYCDVVMRACTDQYAVYSTRETCVGVCAHLPAGDPLEPSNGDTVACRKRQADLAGSTTEPSVYCPEAGPGGAGVCGTNCAGYCGLLKAICPANYTELPDCETACGTLRDTGELNAVTDFSGDTLECRLLHVSAASVDSKTHCPHTQIHPTDPCVDDPTAPPDCANFCRFNLAACTGQYASYESSAQCMAVCGALPRGTNGDHSQNTMGCREWHTYNSLLDPASHCAHAAPGGDGHCGADVPDKTGNCESYCTLLQHACTAQFTAAYATAAACEKACSGEPPTFGAKGDSKYQIGSSKTGNTLQCRLLHVSRALSDPTECASALGQGSCQ